MPSTAVRFCRHAATAALLALAFSTAFARNEADVTIVVDVTDAGRKWTPPTRGQPAFYVPAVTGYSEGGPAIAGEKPPPQDDLLRQLAKALAEQHYFVINAKHPEPSLLLLIGWGAMNPDILEYETAIHEDEEGNVQMAPAEVHFNRRAMLSLVAGKTVQNMALVPEWWRSGDREDAFQASREERYCVVVCAFDWAAAKEKKRVLLWSTKLSTASVGLTMTEALPALVKAGGPFFGRETKLPQRVYAPVIRQGTVEIGTPEVREFLPAPGGDNATPSKTKSER